jgi:WD40 repeat protein
MTYLTWVHLSDWHQRGHDFDRTVIRDSLLSDIRARSTIAPRLADIHLVVFSGDAAYSGQEEEYERARTEFFDPIMASVGLATERLFLAPGNHDLNRTIVREMLPPDLQHPISQQQKVQHWLTDERRRSRAMEPFKDYAKFVSAYTGQPSPDYASFRDFEIGGRKVGLLGLNSAWMSGRNNDASGQIDDYGRLVVGEPQIHNSLTMLETCHLRIVVLHHPFEWLERTDRNRVEERLMNAAHIILRGHEHTPNLSVVTGPTGNCVIIPAGAAYDRRIADDPRYTASYNFTSIDLASGQAEIFFRTWDDRRTAWVTDVSLTGSSGSRRFRLPGFPQRGAARKRSASSRSLKPSRNRPEYGTPATAVNANTLAIRTTVLMDLPEPAFGLSWSVSGDRLACGAYDGCVRWWNLSPSQRADSLAVVGRIPPAQSATRAGSGLREPEHRSLITTVAVLPFDNACVFGTRNGQLWLANTKEDGALEIELPDIRGSETKSYEAIKELVVFNRSFVMALGDRAYGTFLINLQDGGASALRLPSSLSGFTVTNDGKRFAAVPSEGNSISIGLIDAVTADSTLMAIRRPGSRIREYILPTKARAACCKWINNGTHVAVGYEDGTISIVDPGTGHRLVELEGHTEGVFGLSDSSRFGIFASSSTDGTVRIWDSNRWSTLEVIQVSKTHYYHIPLFHPTLPILAVTYENRGVAIWQIDAPLLERTSTGVGPHYYSNAKVVLIGDTGVGKSGLGLVLSGQPFIPTESTHGRRVWVFDQNETEGASGERESREVLLWDMAGQPGYRLVHQLYLNEVAVALVVFDSRSETDPFAGVRYWDRALRQAARMHSGGPTPTKL